MPVWEGLQLIRDPYTAPARARSTVTGIMLVGDAIVLRGGAFVQGAYRLA